MILSFFDAHGACHAIELDVFFEELEEVFPGDFHIRESATDEHFYGGSAERDRGHGAICGDISAADDGDIAGGFEFLRVIEIIHIRGAQFFPGYIKGRAVRFSSGDDDGVKGVAERVGVIDFGIEVQADAIWDHDEFPVFFDDIVRETFVRDHIECAADFFSGFKDVDLEAGAHESRSSGHAGRSSADDGDFLSVWFGANQGV